MNFKLLSELYNKVWTPFFGRILFLFVKQIEGKDSIEKPSYNIKYTNVDKSN